MKGDAGGGEHRIRPQCISTHSHQQQNDKPCGCMCCVVCALTSPKPNTAFPWASQMADIQVMMLVLIFNHFCYTQFTV